MGDTVSSDGESKAVGGSTDNMSSPPMPPSSSEANGSNGNENGQNHDQASATNQPGAESNDQKFPEPDPLTEEEIQMIDDTIDMLRTAQNCQTAVEVDIKLKIDSILRICQRAEQFFLYEPTLLHLKAPVNIVGDIHGQFLDLLRFFELGGFPPEAQYLFLGDYIDRGRMGIESTILLFCYKLRYPSKFFMLRGNHECSQISRMYGFHDECRNKYDLNCWRAVNEVFRTLPFAAIVNDRIFATHGGLSPDLRSLQDIIDLKRPTEVPVEGLLCDLLWADPSVETHTWEMSDRGVSFLFGDEVLNAFMETYGFDLFVRAHQVVTNGYEFFPPNSRKLVTIFSACNYCNQFDNAGAMLVVDQDLVCSFHIIRPRQNSGQGVTTSDDTDSEDDQEINGPMPRPNTPRPD